MKSIIAKFNSKCAQTGKQLRRGDVIYYDPATRKAYHKEAPISKEAQDHEARNVSDYVQAQEEAYWNNATGGYYSR